MKTTKGCLVLRGSTYYARWTVGGKVFQRSTHETEHDAALTVMKRIVAPFAGVGEVEALERTVARLGGRKAEVARLEAEANPPPELGTVVNHDLLSPVWQAFLRSPSRPDSGESTVRQYESEFKRFITWTTEHHPELKHLHQVTRQHAEAYAANLQAAKVSASTFNQHRNLLRLVWRVLADCARVAVNPWDSITPRKLNALATRKQALTPGQFDALLLATERDPDLHDLLTLLAWTGQRLVDGLTLKWGAVDFARGVITLAPRKTARRQGKLLHVPLFPAARDVLNRREEGRPVNPAGHVFPALVEEYERDASIIVKRMKKAFKRAGMETTEERSERGRGVTVYGAHSLRHFAVTAFTSAGMPAAMVKSITGHTSDGMLEHYQHIGADMAGEIAARMTAKALPAPVAANGKGDGTPALLGDSEALRAALAELVKAHGLEAVKGAIGTLATA
jgi:integrase